jgi:predicted MFS family arabinose efflux permease
MLLGGFVSQWVSREAAFLMGAVAAAVGLVVVSGAPEQEIKQAASMRALVSVARDKSLLVSTLLATVYQFAAWGTVLGFTGNWASEVVGLDSLALSLLSATFLLTNTILSRFSGALSRRFGPMRMLMAGFLTCLMGGYGISSFLRARRISRS